MVTNTLTESLLAALENTPKAGVYVIQDGRFVMVNDFTAARSGYRKEEMIGMESTSIIHPEDRQTARENAISMLKGLRNTPYIFRTVSRTGEIHWITEAVSSIEYQGRRAILGTSLDVTELIRAQREIEELKALEASILEAIPHAVLGLQKGRIVFANPGVKKVFGWEPHEIENLDMRIFYPSEAHFRRFIRNLHLTLERQRVFYTEFTCRTRHGSDIECLISATPIGDYEKDGRLVITYEDITDRKRIGRELEESRRRLRQLTAHLEDVREKERAYIARELHDELGQLLTALHMDLILLAQHTKDYDERVRDTVCSSLNLINKITESLRRIYQDLRPAVLDHLGLTAAICWQAEEFQKRTGIRCQIDIFPEEIKLDTNRTLTLFRILQEALTNVARHSGAKEVSITLKQEKGQIVLTIKDDGRGLAKEELDKPNSFGLLGIKERTFLWGGNFSILGKENEGTTVSVSLPLG
ncbi:MAG: PAS domain-containing sensor histidine kinase [Syntrophales bacterium]|nr:PAS domain-containing sensor histidine kinase [Syntrophales bacterium]